MPKITKDGVTVGKNIMLKDRGEELGAALIRSVGHKLNTLAGDGTTTSIVLATAIIREGLKYSTDPNINLQDLRKGLVKAGEGIVEYLEEVKEEVRTRETLEKVALVASNHDRNIGGLVAEAISRVGPSGSILIEAGNTQQSRLYVTEGININRGVPNQRFLLSNENRVEMSNAYVLIFQDSLENTGQLMHLLNQVRDNHRSLLIIAQDISQQVLTNLVYLREKGIADIVAITVPGQGQFTIDTLQDFAFILNTTLYSDINPPSTANCQQLGRALKVIVGREETHITPNEHQEGHSLQIQDRITTLRQQQIGSSQGAHQILGDRINRLLGRQAVILCGGGSETEMHETRDRLVDALNSCKQSLSHGILPGGAVSLLKSIPVLSLPHLNTPSQQIPNRILSKALQQPLKLLLHNAGHYDYATIIETINNHPDNSFGYDVKNMVFGDMMQMGVIDSFNAVKCMLEDSISLASIVLTTECLVVNENNYVSTTLDKYNKIEV